MGSRVVHFQLDASTGVPFYRQIIQQVEQGILSGRLKPGDRLPTIRALAIELKVNPNTIAKSYNELEIRGILVTQVGSGTFVSDKKINLDEIERIKKLEETVAKFIGTMTALGAEKTEIIELVRNFKED
jgi:GntR family transcriptional regulator